MTTPAARPSIALTCPSDQVGRCQQPCHRYGYSLKTQRVQASGEA